MLPVVSNLDLLIASRRLEVAGYATHQATALFGYLTGMSVPLINLATILDSRHGHEPGPGHQSQLHPERIR